ncbi:MAG: glucose 1-dehydrogenase [Candidatus Nanosyncoccaceae bacterium]|jgi:NAD(P)-dependent dehydrogenase (short-subunit alcohol dehydrogenase family)
MKEPILKDKVAVVTGAASGMGKEIAKLYAQEGAKVVVSDINLEGAEATVADIVAAGGEAVATKTDVSKVADTDAMINLAVEKFGKLDILVNNAGIMDNMEEVEKVTEEAWQRIMNINVSGVLFACKKAVEIFKKQGSGNIINISSIGGLQGSRAGVMYTASKHAVVGITKNIAFMYANDNIRCNAIAPGAVATNIGSSMTNVSEFGMGRATAGANMSPRTGEATEIAGPALFLASDKSSFVNGAILVADGGWTAY